MIQQENMGGNNSLKGVFMHVLIKLNILYETSVNNETISRPCPLLRSFSRQAFFGKIISHNRRAKALRED